MQHHSLPKRTHVHVGRGSMSAIEKFGGLVVGWSGRWICDCKVTTFGKLFTPIHADSTSSRATVSLSGNNFIGQVADVHI